MTVSEHPLTAVLYYFAAVTTEVSEEILQVLLPLKNASLSLSEETSPTLSCVLPIVNSILGSMEPEVGDSELVLEMKVALQDCLRESTSSALDTLLIASFIDPRFLNMSFVSVEERQRCFKLVTDAVVTVDNDDICMVQVKEEPLMDGETSPVVHASPPKRIKTEWDSSAGGHDAGHHTGLSRLLGAAVTSVEPVRPVQIRAQLELDKYLSEEPCGLRDDPFAWWLGRQVTYPMLSRLARNVLCMPATSIPSERVFKPHSTVLENRAIIPHEHVDQMVFLHKNLSL